MDRDLPVRLRRSILFTSLGSMIIMGLVVTAFFMHFMYRQLTDQEVNKVAAGLDSRLTSINRHLEHMQGLASQVASRSRIRQNLEAYNAGSLSLSELQQASSNKIDDARRAAPEILGITQLDIRDRPAVIVGQPIDRQYWPPPGNRVGEVTLKGPVEINNQLVLLARAPIVNRQNETVGHDIVIFSMNKLQTIVSDTRGLPSQANILLYQVIPSAPRLFMGTPNAAAQAHLVTDPRHHVLRRLIAQQTDILLPSPLKRHEPVIAFCPIQTLPWGLVVTASAEAIYQPVFQQIFIALGLILLLLVFFGLGLLVVLRPLTGRLLIYSSELEQEVGRKTADLKQELREKSMTQEALRNNSQLLAERVKEMNAIYQLSQIVDRPQISLEDILAKTANIIPSSCLVPEKTYARILFQDQQYCSEPFKEAQCIHQKPLIAREQIVGRLEVMTDGSQYDDDPLDIKKHENVLFNAMAERLGRIISRKWTEQEIMHYSRELKERNEEIKKFAYVVSHDLRAPLMNIRGFQRELDRAMSSLQHKLPASDESLEEILHRDIPEAMEFIQSSVEKMNDQIESLLRFSRIAHLELSVQSLDSNQLVKQVLAGFADPITSQDILVNRGDLPPMQGDQHALEIIWEQLIDNAIKFRHPKRAQHIELGGEKLPNGDIKFWIKDNGAGIAAKDNSRIFDLFSRACSPDIPGYGMGLTLVQNLVRKMGGSILCESSPDWGSLFAFSIPQPPRTS